MRELPLETPLYEVLGARAPLLKRFEYIDIKTAGDLLRHFPSRYEDFSKVYAIDDLEPGQQATIRATIQDITLRRTRRGFSIVEAMLEDGSGTIRAVWFNQPYIMQTLHPEHGANFAGKVSLSDENELYLNSPAYEMVHENVEDQEMNHTARLVPIYPETRGLTSRGIRFAIRTVFRKNPILKEWIPESIRLHYNIPEIHDALRDIHFPEQIEDATRAQRRFAFEDLFLLQLANLKRKLRLAAVAAPVIPADIDLVKEILASLPFSLTTSQKKSLWEIMQDTEKDRPMNRLLQGDVGSGKTIVAAIAAIIAARNGFQTAFMAPTEILAHQHFDTMTKFLKTVPAAGQPVIGILTGTNANVLYDNDLSEKISKKEFEKKLMDGSITIAFGTHALIQKSVGFKNLGLVIIDEQHRFGVEQRAALTARMEAKKSPHFLSMSATPIPRTLALAVFGDLDLSLITELPPGRQPIETKIVPQNGRGAAYEFVRAQIKEGRQAFVICPRIEPAEDQKDNSGAKKYDPHLALLDMKSVKEEYEKLSKTIFPDLRIAMLHGQMKPAEKETIMKKFKDREFDLLVATSVIEVGIDIPNATVMLIEGADRFGLAQLYQFRGRVGRGAHASYCLLMSEAKNPENNQRLKAIIKAKNGFELAEYDLKLRGPGEFLGTKQTGMPDIPMESLRNPQLIEESHAAAAHILTENPTLLKYPLLRAKLTKFSEKIHRE